MAYSFFHGEMVFLDAKKYQVFISSTFTDLIDARTKITEAILSLYHIPIGMEMFSAGDDDQWTVIQNTIDLSDYYVLVLGHRYGSVTDEGISYTEKEYDYAKSKGIPVLAFIMDREAATKPADRESDPSKSAKLDLFVQKAMSNKMVSFWNTPDDLVSKVSIALIKTFGSHPGVGWVRGDQAASPKVMDELASLSKENRELQAQLADLKKLHNKLPLLKVKLNSSDSVNMSYTNFLNYAPLSVPNKLMVSDVPEHLRDLVTNDDLLEFNDAIPEDIENIYKYNQELRLYREVDAMGLELKISVGNQGAVKANNVYVDIHFPDSVILLEGEKADFSLPSKPKLSVNPIEKAENTYKKQKLGFPSLSESIFSSQYTNINFNPELLSAGVGNNLFVKSALASYGSSMEKNKITAHCKELLHTRRIVFSEDYILIPQRPGNYEIKVFTFCEEYSKREEFTIPLIISEQ